MAPGTEFARDFCAGIGPLQLGVVLVIYTNYYQTILELVSFGKIVSLFYQFQYFPEYRTRR